MLQISSLCKSNLSQKIVFSVESRWSPFCKICGCGQSLLVLRHFDWCVYLNPQHLPHEPKEADSCFIIHRLGSPRQGWQQSGCVFWMLVCTNTHFFSLPQISFRVAASLGLVNRLQWCYMWNLKISGLRQDEHREQADKECVITMETVSQGCCWVTT